MAKKIKTTIAPSAEMVKDTKKNLGKAIAFLNQPSTNIEDKIAQHTILKGLNKQLKVVEAELEAELKAMTEDDIKEQLLKAGKISSKDEQVSIAVGDILVTIGTAHKEDINIDDGIRKNEIVLADFGTAMLPYKELQTANNILESVGSAFRLNADGVKLDTTGIKSVYKSVIKDGGELPAHLAPYITTTKYDETSYKEKETKEEGGEEAE